MHRRLNSAEKVQSPIFLCMQSLLECINSRLLHDFCIECISLQSSFYILVAKPLHNCLGVYAVLCQYRTVCMPQAVRMEQGIPQFMMYYSGTVFE